MRQCSMTNAGLVAFTARALLVVCAIGCAVGADDPGQAEFAELHAHHHLPKEPTFAERASATAERDCSSRSSCRDGREVLWSPGIFTRRPRTG